MLVQDGPLPPDQMKQFHSRRGRGRDEPVLGLPRHNLTHSRRRLRELNREPSRATINSRLTILH